MALIRRYGYWVLWPVALIIYYFFAFEIKRTDHAFLFSGFAILVLLAILTHSGIKKSHWWVLFAIGLSFRLTFLFATPHLSDDFYRFTWDGELSKDGYEVFGFVPNAYKKHVKTEHLEKYDALLNASSEEFPSGMNSKKYYSIYPSVNQLVFYTAALGNSPNNGNLTIIRIWVLIAEIVSFFVLRALLIQKNKEHLLSFYWLHPFIIIELSGNLHLEALAIAFTLLALYYAIKNKWIAFALTTSLAIMTKLTPLFILGSSYRTQSLKKWMLTCALTGVITILLFSLVVDYQTFLNFKKSVGLFFAWFSFNSGLFYGLRDLAHAMSGADISSTLSLFFPFICMGILANIVFVNKFNMPTTLLLLFTIYFIFSPIVHPWYITILIPLGILAEKIYPLIWSILIFGTYMAYDTPFEQPMWWIYLEYAFVVYVMLAEFRHRQNWTHRASSFIYAG